MAYAEMPLGPDHFQMLSCFENNESLLEQSQYEPAWQHVPFDFLPWSWAAPSSITFTGESTSTQGSYHSALNFEMPNLAGAPDNAVGTTALGSLDQPLGSYTIQQYPEPNYPSQEASTTYNITPTYIQNPAYSIVSNLNQAHSTQKQAKDKSQRKPRGRRPLSNKTDSRERNTKADSTQNRRYRNRLERNRRAAARCRGRQQNQTNALVSCVESLEDQHRQLSSIYNDLVEQVFQLKSEILSHGDCNCVLIQQYIKGEAQKAVDVYY